MMSSSNLKIAVIGSGAVGLSSAVCLQQIFPFAEITIYADEFFSHTTSIGAGGLFRPECTAAPSLPIMKQWCMESYSHFKDLICDADSNITGVKFVSGYQMSSVSDEVLQNSLLKEILPDYRSMTEKELALFPSDFRWGLFYTTVIVDCRYYLPYLQKLFQDKGGKIIKKRINCLSEVAENSIVVNCTGLGAKKLVNDFRLVSVRGQTIKVKAPWVKHFYYGDGAYIIPGNDFVTLGGIKTFGDYDLKVSQDDKQSIWNRCVKLLPSLEKSEFQWDWVGLRPFRQPVRVEAEVVNIKGKTIKVVHNYGHGGHGITLSWGTSKHAAQLVEGMLKSFSSKM